MRDGIPPGIQNLRLCFIETHRWLRQFQPHRTKCYRPTLTDSTVMAGSDPQLPSRMPLSCVEPGMEGAMAGTPPCPRLRVTPQESLPFVAARFAQDLRGILTSCLRQQGAHSARDRTMTSAERGAPRARTGVGGGGSRHECASAILLPIAPAACDCVRIFRDVMGKRIAKT